MTEVRCPYLNRKVPDEQCRKKTQDPNLTLCLECMLEITVACTDTIVTALFESRTKFDLPTSNAIHQTVEILAERVDAYKVFLKHHDPKHLSEILKNEKKFLKKLENGSYRV